MSHFHISVLQFPSQHKLNPDKNRFCHCFVQFRHIAKAVTRPETVTKPQPRTSKAKKRGESTGFSLTETSIGHPIGHPIGHIISYPVSLYQPSEVLHQPSEGLNQLYTNPFACLHQLYTNFIPTFRPFYTNFRPTLR